MPANLSPLHALPDWLPDAVRLYLDHTADGLSLRALARRDGCHASTVLRTVRRYEKRREDPLLDEALDALVRGRAPRREDPAREEPAPMTVLLRPETSAVDDITLKREGLRILRRLAEPGATLAIAPDMEKAVVMREFPDGRCVRLAVVDRRVAQAFVLQDWIACRKAGRVSTYELGAPGRASLKRMIDEDDQARMASGMAEAPMAFADQHRIWGDKLVAGEEGPRRVRHNLAESPVAVLGRRREKDGRPFLEPGFVEAAERLREDFELAQMGPRVAQNWERFLTGGDRGGFHSDAGLAQGPRAARDRVAAALRDLGPGLGDVALRVCCFLEGIEAAEQRMGWAARSGKIVLRIALQRLRRHYDETYGKHGPLIG
ncbi:DUF6456 domain-containing protein [Tabrizicola oligotrophica]|uniref:Helix-turn-helix domain-containing protein n=1 Tax=Tabrizicola oligotrophica TaxID=2710650 RepID=A0A6M0QRI6_9RHOB|nr:DUF6456 domain-containing protein [Tabrizicola oligotrophica]NEY89042.1 helix-turn-helix domain-containing protein [Tabrizicola oligotrophica]